MVSQAVDVDIVKNCTEVHAQADWTERQFKHMLSVLSLKGLDWHLPPVPPPLHYTASAAVMLAGGPCRQAAGGHSLWSLVTHLRRAACCIDLTDHWSVPSPQSSQCSRQLVGDVQYSGWNCSGGGVL